MIISCGWRQQSHCWRLSKVSAMIKQIACLKYFQKNLTHSRIMLHFLQKMIVNCLFPEKGIFFNFCFLARTVLLDSMV